MTIRRIEAPLYSIGGFEGLLDAAGTVARQFGAEIEVCYSAPLPPVWSCMMPASASPRPI
jgi:hypothetical protein